MVWLKLIITNTNYISQDGIVSDTKTYAITFTILNYISGSIRLRLGNTYGDYVSGNGTYTKYIQCTTSNKFRVYSSPSWCKPINRQRFSKRSRTRLDLELDGVLEMIRR